MYTEISNFETGWVTSEYFVRRMEEVRVIRAEIFETG